MDKGNHILRLGLILLGVLALAALWRLPARAQATLKVQYRAAEVAATSNQIKPHLNIVNGSSSAISLSSLKVRYYYTIDGEKSQAYWCDYATIGCSNVTATFVKMPAAAGDADYYLELGFTGGTLNAGASTGEIQSRFAKSDWTNYTQTGDYSFDPSKTTFTDWNRVTLYHNGVLVWGSEPGGSANPTATVATATAVNNTPTRTNTASSGATATRTRTPTRTATGQTAATATRTNTPAATPSGGFTDNLDSYNTALWTKADGWTNGDPFNVGWRADHINFSGGIMTITLDNVPCPSGCSNRPYASGEYRRNELTGYGLYEGRFKAAKGSGIVGGSFFIYTGPSDNQPWDEIDIEILGKDTTKMQCNYFTNGVGGHETMINLGFDAAAGFHTYGFDYQPNYIKWYVDGALVHTETGARGPLPTHKMKLMMNLWAGIGVDGWLGPFTYTGPLYQQVDWIRFTPSQ